jgi:hypothetical protein
MRRPCSGKAFSKRVTFSFVTLWILGALAVATTGAQEIPRRASSYSPEIPTSVERMPSREEFEQWARVQQDVLRHIELLERRRQEDRRAYQALENKIDRLAMELEALNRALSALTTKPKGAQGKR